MLYSLCKRFSLAAMHILFFAVVIASFFPNIFFNRSLPPFFLGIGEIPARHTVETITFESTYYQDLKKTEDTAFPFWDCKSFRAMLTVPFQRIFGIPLYINYFTLAILSLNFYSVFCLFSLFQDDKKINFVLALFFLFNPASLFLIYRVEYLRIIVFPVFFAIYFFYKASARGHWIDLFLMLFFAFMGFFSYCYYLVFFAVFVAFYFLFNISGINKETLLKILVSSTAITIFLALSRNFVNFTRWSVLQDSYAIEFACGFFGNLSDFFLIHPPIFIAITLVVFIKSYRKTPWYLLALFLFWGILSFGFYLNIVAPFGKGIVCRITMPLYYLSKLSFYIYRINFPIQMSILSSLFLYMAFTHAISIVRKPWLKYLIIGILLLSFYLYFRNPIISDTIVDSQSSLYLPNLIRE